MPRVLFLFFLFSVSKVRTFEVQILLNYSKQFEKEYRCDSFFRADDDDETCCPHFSHLSSLLLSSARCLVVVVIVKETAMSCNCPSCGHRTALLPAAGAVAPMKDYLLVGTCPNPKCDTSQFYGCQCCLDYAPPKYLGRKKHPGVFFQWGKAGEHARLKCHQEALANKRIHEQHQEANAFAFVDDDDDENPASVPIDDSWDDPPNDAAPAPRTNDEWLTSLKGRIGTPLKEREDLDNVGFAANSKAPEFFWYEQLHPGMGMRHLVAKAFDKRSPTEVNEPESRFALKMASLLVQLTEAQREIFAECLLQAVNANDKPPDERQAHALCKCNCNCHERKKVYRSIFKGTKVPLSENEFQKCYLSGPNAIIPNLPHPVPQTSRDGTHAFVSLFDVLANELAKATTFDRFYFDTEVIPRNESDEVISLSDTRAAKKLFGELREEGPDFVLYLWLKEWRDDFDPNNTKKSRNQVWIYTNTICPPPDEKTGKNTYFMALSSKGKDHGLVERFFARELHVLSTEGKRFYHGGLSSIIKVKLGKLSTCVDRPERASMFQCGDHNGTYSAFWGHSCFVDGSVEENHLPSCKVCRRKRTRDQLDGVESVPSSIGCPNNKCSSWNVKHCGFISCAPTKYPLRYDKRDNAPCPPRGRGVPGPPLNPTDSSGVIARRQKKPKNEDYLTFLPTVRLSIQWLKEAVRFAHHNAKTVPPDVSSGAKSPFWNKGETLDYLRACGIAKKFSQDIFESALRKDQEPPFPDSWFFSDALDVNHYAIMHMMFLGNISSDIDAQTLWMSKHKLKAMFGMQANLYLSAVRQLRCHKYFGALPLSTSKWGTGVWVSENYVFWARIIKLFFVMPALHQPTKLANKVYSGELAKILRFASATHACVARLLSTKRVVPDLEGSIQTYLDAMVDVDFLEVEDQNGGNEPAPPSSTVDVGTEAASLHRTSTTETSPSIDWPDAVKEGVRAGEAVCFARTTVPAPAKKKRKKQPNFVKANALGLMSAAESHDFQGPAKLHWEGGFFGEAKIQPVKPLLSIKRSNVDWPTITLLKLYALESIQWLLERSEPTESAKKKKNREMEGAVRVFKNKAELDNCLKKNEPFTAVLSKHDNTLWVPFRPVGEASYTRSAVRLMKLNMNDDEGELLCALCWMSPVQPTETFLSFADLIAINQDFAKEYVLFLPKLQMLNRDTCVFLNKYYCVGHLWTERNREGQFVTPSIDEITFYDWVTEPTSTAQAQGDTSVQTPTTSPQTETTTASAATTTTMHVQYSNR